MAAPQKGTETILVAEDNQDVRLLIKKVLEGNGYTVVEALDGEDAIEKYVSRREEIGLLIVDVVMPNKNGRQVFDSVRNINPQARILFASGYTAELINTKGILEGEMDYVSKPVSPHDLLVKVREILDRE